MGRKKKEQPFIKLDCVDCNDHRRKGGCSQDGCPWLTGQIPTGSVRFGEAAMKLFYRHEKLRPRLEKAVREYKGPWTNIGHMPRLETAQKMTRFYTEKDTPRYFAVLYLLTSSFELFVRTLGCFRDDHLRLDLAQLRDITDHDNSLFCAAREIYKGSEQKIFASLTGRDAVDDTAFQLILTALMVSKYGPAVLRLIP